MKIFSVMLLIVSSAILRADEGKYFKTQKDKIAFYLKAEANFYNFRIEGVIVDPNGELISDVKVSIKKTKDSMNGPISNMPNVIKNGMFDYSTSGSYGWHLFFEKQGYYSARTGFTLAALADMLDSKEAIMEGNTIIKKVKIILYPWGDLNRDLLSVRHNTFYYSNENDGTQKITGVIIPYEGEKGRIRTEEEQQFTFSDEKKLLQSLIYIVPGQNKDGSHDGTIRLKTNIPDSGFVRLEYGGNHFFRNMWEAPESGYQPELVIKEDFGNSHSKAPFIVFYVKALGRYGKGFIMPKDSDSKLGKDKVSLKIYLYINRNRNIRNTTTWIGTNW